MKVLSDDELEKQVSKNKNIGSILLIISFIIIILGIVFTLDYNNKSFAEKFYSENYGLPLLVFGVMLFILGVAFIYSKNSLYVNNERIREKEELRQAQL